MHTDNYGDQARLQGTVAEPAHGPAPLARLGAVLKRADRVAAHYGLPAEHALALCTPHASRSWRAKLAADTAIFEAMGGSIEIVPAGKSGHPEPVLSAKSISWLAGYDV